MAGNEVRWSKTQGSQALRGAIAILVVMLIGIVGHFVFKPDEPPPPSPPAPKAAVEPVRAPRPKSSPAIPPPVAAAPSPAVQEAYDAGEVYLDQLPRGDGGGIDAFPRPGTKPILRGLIVPENFSLPQGYVRHVQVTDDGKELPPILMFHPDYHPPGVVIPPNRVVPEALAPPGMPIEWLEPPSPQR
jgi:hypothetical protein